jgi:hypothetical protein
MKKLLVSAMILLVASVFGQDAKVPDQVKSKFKVLYPNAEEVKWDVEDSDFEVNFEVEDVEISVVFNAAAEVLEVETALEKGDIPNLVKESVSKNFSDWKIEEVAKIVSRGNTTFEIELEKGEQKMDAIFKQDGTLLKKIEKVEDDEKSAEEEND